jgi:hypothetical protein
MVAPLSRDAWQELIDTDYARDRVFDVVAIAAPLSLTSFSQKIKCSD